LQIVVLVLPGLARSCRHCYLLRSASHCTSTALARSAQHSLCPSWTGRGPLRCAAPRSGGRPGSSRRPGRWAERGPAGRLSLSLSLLASGVGVAEAVLAPGHRGRRCSRIWRSRSRGSAGAAVEIEVACPCQRGATRSATARWPFPSSLARRSGGRMAAGRGARWYACTGDLWECEYMCFGNSGMHLWLAFGSVGHGEVGRLST
jgi:hypothetical protein